MSGSFPADSAIAMFEFSNSLKRTFTKVCETFKTIKSLLFPMTASDITSVEFIEDTDDEDKVEQPAQLRRRSKQLQLYSWLIIEVSNFSHGRKNRIHFRPFTASFSSQLSIPLSRTITPMDLRGPDLGKYVKMFNRKLKKK